ncbi:hypothetical protein ACO0LC_23145 [Undibacterium sp. JH2W]|uniref:hypothetical protein n=1 Tax=Undibacterium sp. JH2W TaxID=3413037 RepID=UPI003BF05742
MIAYAFIAIGDEMGAVMDAALLSVFILSLIFLARTWELQQTPGKPACQYVFLLALQQKEFCNSLTNTSLIYQVYLLTFRCTY